MVITLNFLHPDIWEETMKINFWQKKQSYNFTKKQLKKWGVNYHKLIFGKPSYDVFIDDKNLGHKKNWASILFKQLKKNKL